VHPRGQQEISISSVRGISFGTSWNILWSVAIESLFYLWHPTVNKSYLEWGQNAFQAFKKTSYIQSVKG
ncbi:hypothetical protein MKX01_017993, partial [Papaver californicum]